MSTVGALAVRMILLAINQGPERLAGHRPVARSWNIPLTAAVPSCDATWGH
jgi:hypothetical protein